jgi:hypothetical protein
MIKYFCKKLLQNQYIIKFSVLLVFAAIFNNILQLVKNLFTIARGLNLSAASGKSFFQKTAL